MLNISVSFFYEWRHCDKAHRFGIFEDECFECKHCGRKARTDQNGALNLLRRINDPEYMRYMSKEAVKKMERGRYEEWCRSRHE